MSVNLNADDVLNVNDRLHVDDGLNELVNELKIEKNYLGSEISRKFIEEVSSKKVLKILENYDVDVLKYIIACMKKEQNRMFELIMKRRMNYVEQVRRKYKENQDKVKRKVLREKTHVGLDGELCVEYEDDSFIDFSRDPDDTYNLSCGVSVISNGIKKIDELIYYKEKCKRDEENQTRMKQIITLIFHVLLLFTTIYFANNINCY